MATENGAKSAEPAAAQPKEQRELDFSRYPRRRIALLFLYLGWDHDGLVTQEDTQNTVEEHLFNALSKSRLIESREQCQWTRCGRTDKGVSGFRQVASLIVRSTDVSAEGISWTSNENAGNRISSTQELPYVRILNAILPQSIRVLAWSPVAENFSARFDCTERAYVYFMPRANFDIARMNDACSRLVGSHDFRNFCRIDKNKARLEASYVREIRNAVVEPVSDGPSTSAYDLLRVTVRGSGFLWHQIRCLVTLVCEVGAGREEPSLITELLDVEVNAARPQYGMAKDVPLCLFDCSYDGADLDWSFDTVALRQVITTLQKTWADLRIKAELVRSMISVTETFFSDGELTATNALEEFVLDRPTPKKHVPIMKRPLCDSLEAKIEKVAKKARLMENGK